LFFLDTYGITSDPLTRFAVILSALWHDVDHTGVTNGQLVKENDPVAVMYKNRSVAEQNSVELAWSLLMGDQFSDLRRVIYVNENEYRRFRELVVNTVLATDIMDKDLSAARKKRWNDAFAETSDKSTTATAGAANGGISKMDEKAQTFSTNRRATIVIEHLIQASDVSHTMQVSVGLRKFPSPVCDVCHVLCMILTVCFVSALNLSALAYLSKVELQTLSRNVPSLH
jgi:3'5'-cyclic nucleotide phosphodiesterase